MRIKALFMSSILATVVGVSWLLSAQATDATSRSTFLVIYRPGSAWVPGKPVEEQGLADHFRYMLDLYEQGTLKQAGPFIDNSGGAMIVEAADAAAVQALLAIDPAVTGNKMIPEVRPWRLESWDKHLQKRKAKAAPRQ